MKFILLFFIGSTKVSPKSYEANSKDIKIIINKNHLNEFCLYQQNIFHTHMNQTIFQRAKKTHLSRNYVNP